MTLKEDYKKLMQELDTGFDNYRSKEQQLEQDPNNELFKIELESAKKICADNQEKFITLSSKIDLTKQANGEYDEN